ncbi:putative alpha-N-acetylglucosaminidase [Lophium mytilinum]|uniref:Putative alpha-N-acetylglucosaminidase n=1 Tax=Lophium mytilinum TaxID=390894 RepID=A0A6A6Q9Z4_9PEZI|nr:putative alpha-N-acetylglucosaminidase [Lophium mytilinum]
MIFRALLLWVGTVAALSTKGLYDLVERRLPGHENDFSFALDDGYRFGGHDTRLLNDTYSISTAQNGTIAITGNSLSGLATGLHRYLTDFAYVDIHWFIGSRLEQAARNLPHPKTTIHGSSVVPWRYHFNTVTFSYTSAFWTWEDWELELDWMALRGINLPLAWVGAEKLLVEVFQEMGLSDTEITSFLSGPAFQAWNRFGNIQGSWGGELPSSWISSQFELQKKILVRMTDLGMVPILPAFTGFVPRAFPAIYPNASVINGSAWEGFDADYTNVTFLEPFDPLFAKMQELYIHKQVEAYGNITRFWTLDQYDENDPQSGDLAYLNSTTLNTWKALKAADPSAVWVMQGWLFFSNKDFWTEERIEAYLSGVEKDEDMLVLDLFSESQPQWQRTKGYYGKPWIWCQLHNYGGNMGLYGQVENITVDAIASLHSETPPIGFGLTPEGQEGNEIVYDLLLAQAWDSTPISTASYFKTWTQVRYGPKAVPQDLHTAWDILRTTVYNNTNLTSNAVPKSILELSPNITGLANRVGHHPTTLNYAPDTLVAAWKHYLAASHAFPALWENPAYQHDAVDITRQVLANHFLALYTDAITAYHTFNASNSSTAYATLVEKKADMLTVLHTLDALLSTLPQFSLSSWLAAAQASAGNDSAEVAFFEYNARNQITWWGPGGEIADYASKSWGGLVGGYYVPRWEVFFERGVEGRGWKG